MESVAGVVGFENAQTLQIKAFELIRRSEFGNTGLTAVFGTCVTQNRGLEHNFKILRYSCITHEFVHLFVCLCLRDSM